ncbi:hypothetical protein BE08_11700, partial [Sorangium cellulosum]
MAEGRPLDHPRLTVGAAERGVVGHGLLGERPRPCPLAVEPLLDGLRLPRLRLLLLRLLLRLLLLLSLPAT